MGVVEVGQTVAAASVPAQRLMGADLVQNEP